MATVTLTGLQVSLMAEIIEFHHHGQTMVSDVPHQTTAALIRKGLIEDQIDLTPIPTTKALRAFGWVHSVTDLWKDRIGLIHWMGEEVRSYLITFRIESDGAWIAIKVQDKDEGITWHR
jgi:hypothetical protein